MKSTSDLPGSRKDSAWLLECEARYWVNFAKQHGRARLYVHLARIARKRGDQAAEQLKTEMNRQRKVKAD